MVRFSDLLGGNDDSDEPRPAPVATGAGNMDPAPADDALAALAIDTEPTAPVESPKDVLDRLTQYATSARAGDQVADTPAPVPDPTAEIPTTEDTVQKFEAVGDDLLPRGGARKPSRGRKRRP